MKITISLNNGKELIVDAPNYNAAEVTENMNNPQQLVVNIGDVIISKHSISIVQPYEAPVVEA